MGRQPDIVVTEVGDEIASRQSESGTVWTSLATGVLGQVVPSTRGYDHSSPDAFRLPLDPDAIPYRIEKA